MSGVAIEARNLGKTFGSYRYVLRYLNITIQPGERVAVFGQNGAGKTTFLKLVAGLLRPSEGSIRIGGAAPSMSGAGARARAYLGFLSHQTSLYDELSPTENLALYAELYGVQGAKERIALVLEKVGMTEARDRSVRNLSRGMQQRVGLARAILHQPAILVLDEPDTGLDDAARDSMKDLLDDEVEDRTVLVTTHNLELGMQIATRWIILDDGQVAHDVQSQQMNSGEFQSLYRGVLYDKR